MRGQILKSHLRSSASARGLLWKERDKIERERVGGPVIYTPSHDTVHWTWSRLHGTGMAYRQDCIDASNQLDYVSNQSRRMRRGRKLAYGWVLVGRAARVSSDCPPDYPSSERALTRRSTGRGRGRQDRAQAAHLPNEAARPLTVSRRQSSLPLTTPKPEALVARLGPRRAQRTSGRGSTALHQPEHGWNASIQGSLLSACCQCSRSLLPAPLLTRVAACGAWSQGPESLAAAPPFAPCFGCVFLRWSAASAAERKHIV